MYPSANDLLKPFCNAAANLFHLRLLKASRVQARDDSDVAGYYLMHGGVI
jgi:hypothetical protein